MHGQAHGIALKKRYGQHFLRASRYVESMLSKVTLDKSSSIFEIGCGDGFLTRAIQECSFERLWVFEIDESWATYVKDKYPDERMTMFIENILEVDFARFVPNAPWTLLSNLPYQVTFPILHLLEKNRHLLKEGVIMVQEEVAQKIVKKRGRGYGFSSLFFQYYFDWELLDKVPPTAFYPPPKVYSRLLYFKPKENVEPLMNEEEFWIFIKRCFMQPRRTLKNNLQNFHYDFSVVPAEQLSLRAQQMDMPALKDLWKLFNP